MSDKDSNASSDKRLNGASQKTDNNKKPTSDLPGSGTGEKPFPVVCIGASAGGLQALESFFKELPKDNGISFVVITHTDPDHTSMLPEILRKKSQIPVHLIKDGMPIEHDKIFIPPSNRDPIIENGVFRLKARPASSGIHMPIDLFCSHLANEYGTMAGVIILSGTGMDGTRGVYSIKEKAGLVMAQDSSARHTGMPDSAINTDCADIISRPADMPGQLIGYFKNPVNVKALSTGEDTPQSDVLNRILSVLSNQTHHDFSLYKKSTVIRRIERRISLTHCGDTSEYLKFLHHHPEESHALFKDLLIGVTSFFRDPESFAFLKKNVLPGLINRSDEKDTLRVWIPGCASGEEVFSIVFTILECLEETNSSRQIQVFATDINVHAIEKARQGIYPPHIVAELSEQRLKRFFKQERNLYYVKNEVRENIVFAEQDILRDPPFSNLDLLVCRNLLIYLKTEAQNKLMPLFHHTLKKEGILFLGISESIGKFPELFSPLNKSFSIYQKKNNFLPSQIEFPTFTKTHFSINENETDTSSSQSSTSDNLTQAVEKLLLESHTPACVIVNQNQEIVYVRGRIGKYFEPAQGKLSIKITEMAREGLHFPLLSALRKIRENPDKMIHQPGLRVKTNGDHQSVDLTVKHLHHRPLKDCIMIVLLDRSDEQRKSMEPKGSATHGTRIEELENELTRVNRNYRGALEELEYSNQDLKSLNEEMQSSNEELQSTNEEYESSREELQSVNEELSTVNTELHNKIKELNDSYNAITHVLNSTRIAIVFLDTELKVKRFTNEAMTLINLIDTDIGRPIEHILHNLKLKNLGQIARQVLEGFSTHDAEVQTKNGSWYRMTVMVHRKNDHVVEGIVLTFINIDAQKKAQKK